jgi:hypothetical protein
MSLAAGSKTKFRSSLPTLPGLLNCWMQEWVLWTYSLALMMTSLFFSSTAIQMILWHSLRWLGPLAALSWATRVSAACAIYMLSSIPLPAWLVLLSLLQNLKALAFQSRTLPLMFDECQD